MNTEAAAVNHGALSTVTAPPPATAAPPVTAVRARSFVWLLSFYTSRTQHGLCLHMCFLSQHILLLYKLKSPQTSRRWKVRLRSNLFVAITLVRGVERESTQGRRGRLRGGGDAREEDEEE